MPAQSVTSSSRRGTLFSIASQAVGGFIDAMLAVVWTVVLYAYELGSAAFVSVFIWNNLHFGRHLDVRDGALALMLLCLVWYALSRAVMRLKSVPTCTTITLPLSSMPRRLLQLIKRKAANARSCMIGRITTSFQLAVPWLILLAAHLLRP